MNRMRWFRLLAILFGLFNLVGAFAALGAGWMWARNISRTPWPPGGFLWQATTAGLIAVLALGSVRLAGARAVRVWWSAVALSLIDLGVGLIRHAPTCDDWTELAIVLVVAVLSGLLLHAKGPAGQPT